MNYIKDILKLIKREALKTFTDKSLLLIFAVAPMVYPFIYGAFYMDKAEEKVNISYLDYDNSPLSRQLMRDIGASQNIYISHKINNYSQIEDDLAYNRSQGIVIIPKDFSTNIKRGKSTNVNLILPAGRLLVTSDIGIPAYYLSSAFGAKIAASFTAKKGVPVFADQSIAQPIKFEVQYLSNPYLTYGDMLLPAIIVLVLSQIMFIGGAAVQAKEYDIKKRLELINSTRYYSSIIIANSILYLSILTFACLVILAIIAPFYHIQIANINAELLLITELGMMSCLVFGMLVGTFFKDKLSVFVVLAFTSYPFFMLTGYAWPWAQIPEAMQYLAHLIPMVPFVQSYQIITQFGNDMTFASAQLLNTGILILVYSLLYIFRMNYLRWKQNKANIAKK